jgi:dipeptide/tripeptide permease
MAAIQVTVIVVATLVLGAAIFMAIGAIQTTIAVTNFKEHCDLKAANNDCDTALTRNLPEVQKWAFAISCLILGIGVVAACAISVAGYQLYQQRSGGGLPAALAAAIKG